MVNVKQQFKKQRLRKGAWTKMTYVNGYPRKSKLLKSKRESRGLGIFIQHGIQEGILKWSHTDDIIAWIILTKSSFGLENDIYLANINIIPEGSTYLKHGEFILLYQQILKVPDESQIALCGDYNARTGILPDFDFHADGSNAGLNQLLPHDDLGNYDLIKKCSTEMYLLGRQEIN